MDGCIILCVMNMNCDYDYKMDTEPTLNYHLLAIEYQSSKQSQSQLSN